MAAPRSTLWKLEPHTAAKHAILRRYLQAWFAILGTKFPRILYVDGFAGPGAYAGGETGSPLIALDAALANERLIKARVDFLFIEKVPVRAAHLQGLIAGKNLPPNFVVTVEPGRPFEAAFRAFRARSFGVTGRLPPTFAFIDPFGWTGVPFALIRDILAQRSCEVLFNFMYEEINRFLEHPEQHGNFDLLFGTDEWRTAAGLRGPAERNRTLHDLYARQLRESAGAEFVRSFCMRNAGGAIDYYLFFATRELLGLKRMKDAMWTIDRGGDFSFSDATNPDQLVLFGNSPQLEFLEETILARFGDQEIAYETVERFVLGETAFREPHCRAVLRRFETAKPPLLTVRGARAGRKAGTYADGKILLRFAQRQPRLGL